MIELQTSRLRLRTWREEDLPDFAALNADPRVMRYFPSCLSREQSDALAERIQVHFQQHGFGLWVVERSGCPGLIGVVGLLQVGFQAAFTPATEIGWRLAAEHWHHGYASEAAAAALHCAFSELERDQVVSFTVPANRPSMRVMVRLGMHRDASGDFLHPRLPEGDPLRRHVLYRLSARQWRQQNGM